MARLIAERVDTLPALAEVFREHGYGATSLSMITAATGLGKGSLYHFFPGGKQEMTSAVPGNVEQWFATNVFAPLEDRRADASDRVHVLTRLNSTSTRNALALSDGRDLVQAQVRGYFARWGSGPSWRTDWIRT